MGWLVGFSVVLLVLVGEKEVASTHHPILHLLHHHIHKHFGVGKQT
jgi:hypothetical protein